MVYDDFFFTVFCETGTHQEMLHNEGGNLRVGGVQ